MKETAPLILRRTSRGLEAVDAMDHERLQELPLGKDVEVVVKYRKRSLPQLRLYWKMLDEVVKATDAYPNKEILHEILKYQMGYTTPAKLLNGQTVEFPNSAAFDAMDAEEFRGFMDRAVRLLTERHGFDCLAFAEAK